MVVLFWANGNGGCRSKPRIDWQTYGSVVGHYSTAWCVMLYSPSRRSALERPSVLYAASSIVVYSDVADLNPLLTPKEWMPGSASAIRARNRRCSEHDSDKNQDQQDL